MRRAPRLFEARIVGACVGIVAGALALGACADQRDTTVTGLVALSAPTASHERRMTEEEARALRDGVVRHLVRVRRLDPADHASRMFAQQWLGIVERVRQYVDVIEVADVAEHHGSVALEPTQLRALHR
jgi:hypothetical protein